MISIDRVTKTFGEGKSAFTALRAVSVDIRENEFFTLLGPSGCGKTTLLRAVAGFIDPEEGQISLDGQDLLSLPPHSRPVNTVFQSYALFPHMSVADNIAFGPEMLNQSKAEIRATVDEMLALVQMTEMADRKTSQISGGQQQRVALARALAPKPKVLLLDEPLSALDFKLRKEMQIELKRLQAETGITFVFVTHDQEEALTMSDRIAVMNEGQILQIGEPRAVYDHPAERFVADFIGETNFLTARVVATRDSQATIKLSSGATTTAAHSGSIGTDTDGLDEGAEVSVALRPEHASLCLAGSALLSGALTNIVYSGTDTHFHIKLPDNSRFIVRRQNRPDQIDEYAIGNDVGITFGAGVAQILRD